MKTEDDVRYCPETIKRCREQRGFTLEEAAHKARVSVADIEAIESGQRRPTYDEGLILASIYWVPLWVFMKPELPPKHDFYALDALAEPVKRVKRTLECIINRLTFSQDVVDLEDVENIQGLAHQLEEEIIDLWDFLGVPYEENTGVTSFYLERVKQLMKEGKYCPPGPKNPTPGEFRCGHTMDSGDAPQAEGE